MRKVALSRNLMNLKHQILRQAGFCSRLIPQLEEAESLELVFDKFGSGKLTMLSTLSENPETLCSTQMQGTLVSFLLFRSVDSV